MRAAKAQALLSGRDYVAPDDVQAILPQTVAHRLVPRRRLGVRQGVLRDDTLLEQDDGLVVAAAARGDLACQHLLRR